MNKFLFFAMLTALIISCTEEPQMQQQIKPTKGYYILNSGRFENNNATLTYYDKETKTVTEGVFQSLNGKQIGDTGNDIIIYGSKMYITATGSNVIHVTSTDAKLIKSIQPLIGDQPEKPRYLVADGKYVYVTLYSGFVAQIDTATLEITKKVAVGVRPEQIALLNGKLYVTNTGDFNIEYGNTVSVIDINLWTVVQTLTVTLNPTLITPSGYGNLYLISSGNYGDIKSTLQSITTEGQGEVKVIGKATDMVVCNNTLYTIYGEFGDPNVQYIAYNAQTGSVTSEQYKPDSITITNPYKLSADPTSNNLFITSSDFTNTGDVYIFSTITGELVTTFDSKGINPIKVIPLK